MLGAKPAFVPMNFKVHFYDEESEGIDNQSHRSPISNLLYLTVTTHDITFVVGKLSSRTKKGPLESYLDSSYILKIY